MCRSLVLEDALMWIGLDFSLAKLQCCACVQHHCLPGCPGSRQHRPGRRLCRMQAAGNPEDIGSHSTTTQQLELDSPIVASSGQHTKNDCRQDALQHLQAAQVTSAVVMVAMTSPRAADTILPKVSTILSRYFSRPFSASTTAAQASSSECIVEGQPLTTTGTGGQTAATSSRHHQRSRQAESASSRAQHVRHQAKTAVLGHHSFSCWESWCCVGAQPGSTTAARHAGTLPQGIPCDWASPADPLAGLFSPEAAPGMHTRSPKSSPATG